MKTDAPFESQGLRVPWTQDSFNKLFVDWTCKWRSMSMQGEPNVSHTSSCPALLTSAHCYKSQPHLATVQSLLRLAGSKLSWENTQVDSFLCPLPFPPSELLAFLPLTSPHLIPRGKCSGWPFKDNYWWDGIFLCNADEIDFIDPRTQTYNTSEMYLSIRVFKNPRERY